ncbi:hypothetical protein LTR70_004192 [Exophiala xenobiotica]|uniref:Micro-fibrillar-associated protein 1 C-terminal domain-containing protein n=1 Tax=Lithohypha guttulata TaxID=1690604 RepID=A0ABR0KE64_9EURO|nr:hypothetical protein LTR24_003674 [Lithohypha guttulata]KAK5321479.1 hypothetical protein LTR70_004192 [Exophiala xenobiotica]
MPPPIPAHQKRFTANPTRPARYRPGKGVQEEESSDEEEEDEVQQPQQAQRKPQARPRAPVKPRVEDEDDDDEEGFVTEEEDEADGGAPVCLPVAKTASHTEQPTQRTVPAPTRQPVPQQEEESSEDEEESGSEEESEEESSSEEEAPRRKFQRPTFIKKTNRKHSATSHADAEDETPAPEISSSHHTDDTAARRLAEAESMIKTTIERDTAARLAGKKSWDDDDDLPAEVLVDDTDGIDPEAEHLAWRLRELHRLKRDREAMVAREKELEEIERRRNLTKEEREAEDRNFLTKQKEERDAGRGQAAYLSKYHHKGAFFMDDADSERLAKRDLIGARFEGDVDKSVLPEYMRVRDMTKLGKKGRTRYTDLKGTDTGRFGEDVKRWRGSGYQNDHRDGGDLRGVDERFLPDDDRKGGGPTASGANRLISPTVDIEIEIETKAEEVFELTVKVAVAQEVKLKITPSQTKEKESFAIP